MGIHVSLLAHWGRERWGPGWWLANFQINHFFHSIWDDDGRLTTIFRWLGLPPIRKKIAQTQAIWAETVLPSAGVVVFKGRRLLGDGIAIRWSLMFLRFRSHSAFCSVRSVSDMFTLDHSQCFEGDVFSFHGYVGCLNISIARFPVLPLNLPCPGLEQGLEGWETELKTSTL
jgi:hypothetical protein